jgi:hypothetical protein
MGLKPIFALFCTEEEATPPMAGFLIYPKLFTFTDEILRND